MKPVKICENLLNHLKSIGTLADNILGDIPCKEIQR